MDDKQADRILKELTKSICKVPEDSLDVYNEGCGCTCRECHDNLKKLINK